MTGVYKMSSNWMLTIPRKKCTKKKLSMFIDLNDVHKWIIGYEVGRGGYEHFQVRMNLSKEKETAFNLLKLWFEDAHVEECSDTWEYERKSGHYVCSGDTVKILSCRYGRLRPNQREILRRCMQQSDRSITVVFDPVGGIGKSWLTRWLYETGRGFYVPPTIGNAKGIIQHIASGYQGEDIIVIDIPRASKWSTELYEVIEAVKDGLVYDTRYSAHTRDIWGVKVLVMTNTLPKIDKLSLDRWQIIDAGKMQGGAVAPPAPPSGALRPPNPHAWDSRVVCGGLNRNTSVPLPPFRGEEEV